GRYVEVGGGRVFVLDNAGTVHAWDIATGKPHWSRTLVRRSQETWPFAELAWTPGGLYVAIEVAEWGFGDRYEAVRFGLNPTRGHVRWQRKGGPDYHLPPLGLDEDVIVYGDGPLRLQVATGKVVWRRQLYPSAAELVGGVLVVDNSNGVVGLNPATGKRLWRLAIPAESGSYGTLPTIADGRQVWLDTRHTLVLCVTAWGKLQWKAKRPFTGYATIAGPGRLVTRESRRILGYAPGRHPPLPTQEPARQALATELVAHYELLDEAERQRLRALAPHVVQPLLARYVRWALEEAAMTRAERRQNSRVRSLLQDLEPDLRAAAGRPDTAALVRALSQLPSRNEWREPLERVLQARGDPAVYVSALVQNLRALPPNARYPCAALDAVARSSDPAGVAFLVEALRDPTAPTAWRQAAFYHLAGTGGDAGVAAVRAARPRRAPRPPWWERVRTLLDPKWKPQLATDNLGRSWALFDDAVLGNGRDLFIVEKTPAGWGRPLFTGVWIRRDGDSTEPKSVRGIPSEKVLKSDWVRLFPTDPRLRRDRDGDGLTDLVEQRLGTDPRRDDTDRDGLGDAVDPCPNAAPRRLGDDEQVIAAALEARFFLQEWCPPAVLEIPRVRPFEIYGYPNTLFWDSAAQRALTKHWGVDILSLAADRGSPLIRYGPARKTARVLLCRDSNPQNADWYEYRLRKIGSEWFVVDVTLKGMS
ncbi:MAG: PQQ-like beta-propeller repeat protein, partial [Armatimonadetes bacterium]|nr:PQQ-like beta-propeller repeat protein [Armatimonadota bacterium]